MCALTEIERHVADVIEGGVRGGGATADGAVLPFALLRAWPVVRRQVHSVRVAALTPGALPDSHQRVPAKCTHKNPNIVLSPSVSLAHKRTQTNKRLVRKSKTKTTQAQAVRVFAHAPFLQALSGADSRGHVDAGGG